MIILKAFRFQCQRKMLGIRWQDRVRNADISLRTDCLQRPTSSVNGGLLFSATWSGCQPLPELIRP